MSPKSANSTCRGASFVHQSQVRLSLGLLVLGLLTAITGCPRTKTTKPEAVENAPPKVEVLPDDDAIVQKYVEAGFQVDKNSEGVVVLVSAAANADNPDLVAAPVFLVATFLFSVALL